MELLPVGLRIEKGAIVLGNASAPSVIVAHFSQASGTLDVAQSRCALDLYKQVLNLTFRRVLVTCNPNPDYDEPMLSTGRKVFEHAKADLGGLDFAAFGDLLKDYSRSAPSAPVPNRKEYATWENVLVTPALEITYYADVPGQVPGHVTTHEKASSGGSMDVGNGDLPPEWGIEMVVHSAELSYGPWTDRQRAELQRVFFPQTFHDTHATAKLQPGETRLCVEMAVLIDFRGPTSLRIPFRDVSKVAFVASRRYACSRLCAGLAVRCVWRPDACEGCEAGAGVARRQVRQRLHVALQRAHGSGRERFQHDFGLQHVRHDRGRTGPVRIRLSQSGCMQGSFTTPLLCYKG